MNRKAVSILLSALTLACYGQEAEKDVDNHQAERQEWFYSQREYPLGHIPTGARINAIAAIARQASSGCCCAPLPTRPIPTIGL